MTPFSQRNPCWFHTNGSYGAVSLQPTTWPPLFTARPVLPASQGSVGGWYRVPKSVRDPAMPDDSHRQPRAAEIAIAGHLSALVDVEGLRPAHWANVELLEALVLGPEEGVIAGNANHLRSVIDAVARRQSWRDPHPRAHRDRSSGRPWSR